MTKLLKSHQINTDTLSSYSNYVQLCVHLCVCTCAREDLISASLQYYFLGKLVINLQEYK